MSNFYFDHWDAFAAVFPKDRHIIGKAHTVSIEQDNSNTRHYLGRMTRKTKIVTKSETMIHLSMKLLSHLTSDNGFEAYQKQFLSIFM
jgi:IS1 family transposase